LSRYALIRVASSLVKFLKVLIHVNCKGKGKIEHHIKAYWGSGGIASWILDLETRWR
jgi:hypothetical protein